MRKTAFRSAPLKQRFAALVIDFGIIAAYILLLLAATLAFYSFVLKEIPNLTELFGVVGAQAVGFAALTLPVGCYFFITEASARGASFGKRAAGLRVRAVDGGPAAWHQVAMRTIVKLLPWELAHTFVYQVVYYSESGGAVPVWVIAGLVAANVLPLVYVGTVLLGKYRRAPHDLIAKTVVVVSSQKRRNNSS